MDYLKKLWHTEWLVIKLNRKTVMVLLAGLVLYTTYRIAYRRGFYAAIDATQQMFDQDKAETSKSS